MWSTGMLWQHPDGASLTGARREGLGPLIPALQLLIPALQPTRITQIPAVPTRISSIPAVPCSPPGSHRSQLCPAAHQGHIHPSCAHQGPTNSSRAHQDHTDPSHALQPTRQNLGHSGLPPRCPQTPGPPSPAHPDPKPRSTSSWRVRGGSRGVSQVEPPPLGCRGDGADGSSAVCLYVTCPCPRAGPALHKRHP